MTSLALTAPVASQQPTQAQRDAVRAACRSDYEAHCASVPPGGKPALMCLKKNLASLSEPCQRAVNAIVGAAAPAAQPSAPAAATAAPAASAASTASPATAANPPAAAPPAAATTPKAAAVPPPSGGGQVAVGAAAPAAMPRAMSPRQEIVLVRSSCGRDFRMLCGDVPLGGGRVIECLRANEASLSARCQSAMAGLRR
ncbi:cysteine rich repeat-containing protein [Bradyrhizobium sp. 2TAF24]|uniref:cysteine rich repeat-containing protein n=1 Tax=Bradyrhizobium sp. 2TAF24 TaxID=3233011 RepID=UPI003F93996D